MVIEIKGREELMSFLARDPRLSVYFIGDLDSRYFEKCQWFALKDLNNKIISLILLYHHPKVATILSIGEPEGVKEIIEKKKNVWPAKFHSHICLDHVSIFEKHYRLSDKTNVLRMIKEKEAMEVFPPEQNYKQVIKLTDNHREQIYDILKDLPENFFTLEDLKSNYYFGIFHESKLVTMSGVQVVSEKFKVAALGNIVTKKNYRRQNYSTICTEYLIKELLKVVDIVSLNVVSDNFGAIDMYKKLGFHIHSKLLLTFCDRND